MCVRLTLPTKAMRIERGQRVNQTLHLLGDHFAFGGVAGGTGSGVSGFPIVTDHAGEQSKGRDPLRPVASSQPRCHQMTGNAEVLALAA